MYYLERISKTTTLWKCLRMNENLHTAFHNSSKRVRTFFGKMEEDFSVFLNNYEEPCLDYNYLTEQKLRHLNKQFDGEAKQNYRDDIKNVCESYEDAKCLLVIKQSSIHKQKRISQCLKSLMIGSVVEK